MGKVTIKDVAREAGVSISTVSNALNGVDVLHPDTKAHILEVAERMHYIPNLNGRNLKAQETRVIGLFADYMGGPYMGALTDSMARQCNASGYEFNIFITSDSASIMANLFGHRVDGAIIVNKLLSEEQEEEIKDANIPVVYLNREMAGPYQTGVFFDSYGAGRLAATYLLSKGCEKLGLMEGPNTYDSTERSRGFRDVLAEKGIELDERYVWKGEFGRENAYDEIYTFLNEIEPKKRKKFLPQGIFAANDLSAMGCIEALTQFGVRVPEQVKVLGCDDIELCRYVQPMLTTIRTNFEEQGAVAVQCLIKMLKEDSYGSLKRLSCQIVERMSV